MPAAPQWGSVPRTSTGQLREARESSRMISVNHEINRGGPPGDRPRTSRGAGGGWAGRKLLGTLAAPAVPTTGRSTPEVSSREDNAGYRT